MTAPARIVLWQLAISHYSEKVRWALEHKSLQHERREPLPGLHIAVALWLSRGSAFTLPMLELDGRRVAGSTAIIEALERHCPEPALLPSAPGQRQRALALCEWFDRELGPSVRRAAFYEAGRDRERMMRLAAQSSPALAKRLGPLLALYARAFTSVRYGAGSARAASLAREGVLRALDHLEAQLGNEEYLVAGAFSAADLTAACLFMPLVAPAQGALAVDDLPRPFVRFRASLQQRPGFRWVQEMFARHRVPVQGAAAAPGASLQEAT